MSVPVKIVRNTSRVDKWILDDEKKRIVVPPYSTMPLDDHLAEAMVAKNAPHVEYVDTVSSVHEPEYAGNRIWLYNCTGNPDAEPTIKVKAPIKGDPSNTKEEVNPEYHGRVLCWNKDLGQRIQPAEQGDGNEMLNLGTEKVPLHPWTRRSFPDHIARWILGNVQPNAKRDETDGTTKIEVRRSREPMAFEPDHTWPYAHLVKYAQLIDPESAKGCYTQADITRVAKKNDIASEQVENDQKILLLKRLFFKVADVAYTPPTREEFYAYIKETDPETLGDPEVEKAKTEARREEARLRDEIEELRAQNVKLEKNQKKTPGRKKKPENQATT